MMKLEKEQQEEVLNRIKNLNTYFTFKEISENYNISEVYLYKMMSGEKMPTQKVYRKLFKSVDNIKIIV